jgi:hypothetical protein
LNRYDRHAADPLVAQENADLAQDVADETNSFELAKAISDMFDDEETDE